MSGRRRSLAFKAYTQESGKKESFKVSELYVNKDGMPIQAMIRHKNDDETAVRLVEV